MWEDAHYFKLQLTNFSKQSTEPSYHITLFKLITFYPFCNFVYRIPEKP